MTKQKRASPLVSASSPGRHRAADGHHRRLPAEQEQRLERFIHLSLNPLRGGRRRNRRPDQEQRAAVHGIRISPPILSRLRVWTAWRTAPAPRKSSPLNAAWFRAQQSSQASANAASAGCPSAASSSSALHAHEHDPDVLDAAERQQPLQIVLDQRAYSTPSTAETIPSARIRPPHQADQASSQPTRSRP
ncbi:MAG: hypothetical protein U0893_12025 [Chloroflexota bacterium]